MPSHEYGGAYPVNDTTLSEFSYTGSDSSLEEVDYGQDSIDGQD